MLTYTPLDLTPFGAVVGGLGIVLQIALAGAFVTGVALLVRRKTRPAGAAVLGLLALLGFGLSLGLQPRPTVEPRLAATPRAASAAAAEAHFEQRCKEAGERIVRTAAEVRGVLLLNGRPSVIDDADQFRLDDPYGRNCSGVDDCIAGYLYDHKMVRVGDSTSFRPSTPKLYDYVDFVDPTDGVRRRFTKSGPNAPLERRPVAPTDPLPRYGVRWVDVSSSEDRGHWIAGGAIQVVDGASQDVIAERVGYLRDVGLGDRGGFRSPWSHARSARTACPSLDEHNQSFVAKVLRPSAQTAN